MELHYCERFLFVLRFAHRIRLSRNRMYICICTGITDSDIKRCVEQKGVEDIKGLKAELGACGQCGKCVPEARRILSACQVEKSFEKSGRKAA